MTTPNKLLEKITEFVVRHKLPLLIGSGALLAAILAVVLIQSFVSSNQLKAAREYDNIVNNINYAQYVTNRSDSEKIFQEQMSRLDGLIQTYPNTVGSVRAKLLLGKVLYEDASRSGKTELLNTAISYYKSVVDAPVADFFKALALIGAAQCSEQKNDYSGAFGFFNQVVLKYGKEGFNPIAVIGMARAKEMLGESANAIAYYRQAAQDYPDSLWSRYAKGKIYSFNETVSGPTNGVLPGTNTGQSTSLPYIIQ